MRIGVLALQGDFREHRRAFEALGHEVAEVRLPADLEDIDALAIPGGESTTIGKLATIYGMIEPLQKHIRMGLPTLGTCAGMIFLARGVTRGEQPQLAVLDAIVERNAYGRQNESFEADLDIAGFDAPMRAVFIRAPRIAEIGPDVDVLATVEGRPVAVRQGNVVAISFHPELTDDRRFQQMLVAMVQSGEPIDAKVRAQEPHGYEREERA
jgi:5'-phosphate synthase pdxT subunit